MDKRIERINKDRKFIIGGVNGISKLISNLYLYNNNEIKKQILIRDGIILNDWNCYQVHDLDVIIKNIAYGYFDNPTTDYVDSCIGSFDFFKLYDKENIKICANIINNSDFDDDDKLELLKIIKNYEFDFSVTEQISELYDIESTYRLIRIIEFIKDYTIEKEFRLSYLRTFLESLNDSIDKNNELLKSDAKKHLKDCASVINIFLKDLLFIINKDLKEYVDLIGNSQIRIENNKTENPKIINPFPDIFKSACTYDFFQTYSKKHIIESYTDYSYLFQRLLDNKLIHKKKHLEYVEWLKTNNFINETEYQKFLSKGFLVSLQKSYSENRQNNFNGIFNLEKS